MSSCSKAPRGLFVLLWGTRIFTGTSISPSPSLRQCPDRYTIRAGRNLPDKEFRYLRTVIVTAAVHRGFGLALARRPLTFRHWAGVSPYTSAYAFAETCVFVKQSPGPVPCGRSVLRRRAASHSPALLLPKLRSQFAEFLNEGSLVHLTVLTVTYQSRFAVRALRFWQRHFSRRPGLTAVESPCGSSSPAPYLNLGTDLPVPSRLRLGTQPLHRHAAATLPRHAFALRESKAVLEY
jgi:hypothetical protein